MSVKNRIELLKPGDLVRVRLAKTKNRFRLNDDIERKKFLAIVADIWCSKPYFEHVSIGLRIVNEDASIKYHIFLSADFEDIKKITQLEEEDLL